MSNRVVTLEQAGKARQRRNGRVKAVVLAGGRGTRLAPYSTILPKPLMPIGDCSILEVVLGQLVESLITDVVLCVGHLSHLIEAVLTNGRTHGANITYVRETEPLGTAAPLRLVEGLDDTFLLMNGDVLTTLDYVDLVRHHRRSRNLVTIATHERPIRIDYGVLKLGKNGTRNRVLEYIEKPEMSSTVSMGIYVIEPEIFSYIPTSGYFDFPDLVHALLENRRRVGVYRFDGLWFDIGRRDDFEQAVSAWFEREELEGTLTSSVGAAVGAKH
jgi:NDP-mannose synthase